MKRSSLAATHIPLLVRAFDLSRGDVLECGTGYFSTGYLDNLCSITDRKMVSYETSPRWYERAKRFQSDYHDVRFIGDWDEAILTDRHWGMVFIDHKPHARRAVETERVKDHADFIVCHDTQPNAAGLYDYVKVFPLFCYRYDYKKIVPWTSIVSNFIDVSALALIDDLTERLLHK